jgi:hypothetical protein
MLTYKNPVSIEISLEICFHLNTVTALSEVRFNLAVNLDIVVNPAV